MTTAEKLSKIQIEFKAKKSRFNSFGKYNFRSAEDILEALKPMNEKYRVYFTINEQYLHTNGLPIIETKASMFDIDENNAAIAKNFEDLGHRFSSLAPFWSIGCKGLLRQALKRSRLDFFGFRERQQKRQKDS